MSRSYTSSPPSASMACIETALLFLNIVMNFGRFQKLRLFKRFSENMCVKKKHSRDLDAEVQQTA
jgi:hypothetical protein